MVTFFVTLLDDWPVCYNKLYGKAQTSEHVPNTDSSVINQF